MNNTRFFNTIQFHYNTSIVIQYHTNTNKILNIFTPCKVVNTFESSRIKFEEKLTVPKGFSVQVITPVGSHLDPENVQDYQMIKLNLELLKDMNYLIHCHPIWNADIACNVLRQVYLVLLIFQSSIAIRITGLLYCIAIQNSKTCSSLIITNRGVSWPYFYFQI